MELAAAYLEGARVKEFGHHVDATGVADEDDAVGELLGEEMEVEYGTIGVDDEFGFGYEFLFHDAY